MKPPKVVLHVMAGSGTNDAFYGVNGSVHTILRGKAGVEFNFVSYCGQFLDGETANRFVTDCRDAQVVIVDAWNHPTSDIETWGSRFDPHQSMAGVVRRVLDVNPTAQVFADLMEGVHEVAVHKYAQPIHNWHDDIIATAIKNSVKTEGLPEVLVFDDSPNNTQAARAQLAGEYNVTTVQNYDQAERALQTVKFDIVLFDLFVPASSNNQGKEGQKVAGQLMPITPFLILLAMKYGIKKIGLLTDTGHHSHPASACLDVFGREPFPIGDSVVLMSNIDFTEQNGVRTKNWKNVVKGLVRS